MLIKSLKCYLDPYDYWMFDDWTICCNSKLRVLFPDIKEGIFELHDTREEGSRPILFDSRLLAIGEYNEPMFQYVYETVKKLGFGLYYLKVR